MLARQNNLVRIGLYAQIHTHQHIHCADSEIIFSFVILLENLLLFFTSFSFVCICNRYYHLMTSKMSAKMLNDCLHEMSWLHSSTNNGHQPIKGWNGIYEFFSRCLCKYRCADDCKCRLCMERSIRWGLITIKRNYAESLIRIARFHLTTVRAMSTQVARRPLHYIG